LKGTETTVESATKREVHFFDGELSTLIRGEGGILLTPEGRHVVAVTETINPQDLQRQGGVYKRRGDPAKRIIKLFYVD